MDWKDAGLFTNSRSITVGNLVPGTTYVFRRTGRRYHRLGRLERSGRAYGDLAASPFGRGPARQPAKREPVRAKPQGKGWRAG